MPKEVRLDNKSLPIREFQLKWMCQNAAICMIAKRGSGKSWVCRSILHQFRHLPGGVIISPTDEMSCFYGKFFPSVYIHYEYHIEIIEQLLYRQKHIIEKMKKLYKQKRKIDPRAFLVMDDCLASKGSWMKDEVIKTIFMNGRHYQLMYILTMQYCLGINPSMRSNFDYIFLLADDFVSNQKRLYEHYAGMFVSFKSFRDVFGVLTEDFGCMVINNKGNRKTFVDKIFYYKAKKENLKSMGCKQFNDFHKANFDKNWQKNGKIDYNKMMGDKKHKIRVLKM